MRIQTLNHSVYQHQYHIVWGTKYRRKYLKEYVKPALIESFNQTLKKYPTLFMIEMNTGDDHVHIQIEIPPNIAVSSAVQKIKQRSSIDLSRKFKFIREMYIEDSIWSVGYFSSTIGLNEEQIRKYIEHQNRRELPQQAGFEFS
ncbi:MAG: IS200/IS605 family transposase [Patescibacteria group bacterium]